MATSITAEQMARGRELASKVKLPWKGDRSDGSIKYRLNAADDSVVLFCDDYQYGFQRENDEQYAIHAANTLPAALDEIERLRGEVERLKLESEEWRKTACRALDGVPK